MFEIETEKGLVLYNIIKENGEKVTNFSLHSLDIEYIESCLEDSIDSGEFYVKNINDNNILDGLYICNWIKRV